MNITVKQAELAKTLFQIEDKRFLADIEAFIQDGFSKYQQKKSNTEKELTEIEKLHKIAEEPTPYHIPLEQLVKEQEFTNQGFAEALNSVDDSLFEDENLEELLNTLTK